MKTYDRFYIDGRWVPAHGTDFAEVVNPATEEVIARVALGDADDVDAAVSAAARAFEPWAALPVAERAGHLRALREAMKERAEELAAVITAEMGAPLKVASRVQVGLPLAVLASVEAAVTQLTWEEEVGNSLVVREPVGVVGCITPWNYPLHQVIAKIAPALAAGCTVVLKPSELAPLDALLLAEIIDSVGVPAGVVNIIVGTGSVVGEAIAAHPGVAMVSFTGSTRAGRRVAELAAATVKRVALELGGKSAAIVTADADLDTAVTAVVRNAYLNSGQTCAALTRLLVPAAAQEEAVAIAVRAAERFRPGDPTDPSSNLGPLVSAAQRDRVRGYIDSGVAEGAQLATGGSEPPDGCDRGYFVRPTVFARVDNHMRIAREEIFGPVLCVIPYANEDEAVRLANDSDYGLAGAVWAADRDHALALARRLRTGQVEVNGGAFNAAAPFGGYRQSGVGRELGAHGISEFLEVKALQL